MNNRRKFIQQGSMAAAASIVFRPLQSIAAIASGPSVKTSIANHLIFIHTAGLFAQKHKTTLAFIDDVKNRAGEALLVDAGKDNNGHSLQFDASASKTAAQQYVSWTIVRKKGIRTGIITIAEGKHNADVISLINHTAKFLKDTKQCKLVACLSHLGYENKYTVDDKKLASASKNIDIIIGAHPHNFSKHPMILANSLREEVIVHSASSNIFSVGKIEIGFDAAGNKNHLHILNKVPEKRERYLGIIPS
ncbi:MAG: hypothetical protein K2X48_01265 [Chitinophagaceae bacterium]|nr:hypothetical protein [Chitinophagaceae bacterium]